MIEKGERITAGCCRTSHNGLKLQSIAIELYEWDHDGFADKTRWLRQFRRDGRTN
jgi:hypothetical protein